MAQAEPVDWDGALEQARALMASDPSASLALLDSMLGPVDAPFETGGDPLTLAQMNRLRSEILRNRGAYALASLEAQRFRQRADSTEDLEQQAYARFLLGTIEAEQGSYGAAMEFFHAARALLDASGQFDDQALIFNAIGMTHHFGGDLERARAYTERAVALARQAGNELLLATYTGNLANIVAGLEGPEAALPLQREVRALGQSLGIDSVIMLAEVNICRLLIDAGELAEADVFCPEVVERIANIAPVRVQAGSFMTLADLQVALGRTEPALEAYETALGLAAGAVPTVHREILEKLAAFHEQRGDLTASLQRTRELLQLRDAELERERQALVEELEIRYELERTNAELELLRLDAELKSSQIRLRNGLLLALGLVLLITMVSIVGMLRAKRIEAGLQETLALRNRELERALQQISELALTDPLTGLLNRRAIEDAALQEMARARRAAWPISIALCDVDHFKPINDQHGHAVGDEVLVGLAERLRGNFRECDRVARWGGEEFLCLLTETTASAAEAAIGRLRAELAAHPIETRIGPVEVTLTWGLAELDDDLHAAIRRADQALYTGKRDGRDRTVVHGRKDSA